MARKTWDIDLAISAPQIFLVEHFNDKNAVLCVIDLGKLHFTNREPNTGIKTSIATNNEEDDEGMNFKLQVYHNAWIYKVLIKVFFTLNPKCFFNLRKTNENIDTIDNTFIIIFIEINLTMYRKVYPI